MQRKPESLHVKKMHKPPIRRPPPPLPRVPISADREAAIVEPFAEQPQLTAPEGVVSQQEIAPQRRGIFRLLLEGFCRLVLSLLGIVTLMLGLAIVATIPVLQFISLGYLLEVSGRIARTGRLREGFIGLRPAGIAGVFLAGLGLTWLGLRALSSLAISAEIIAPGSPASARLGGATAIVLAVVAGVVLFVFGLIQFFRPGTYGQLRDGVWNFVTGRLPYYFWLGLRGFVGGFIWLVVPISLLVGATLLPGSDQAGAALSVLRGLLGAFLLMVVIVYLPFLQTRMAAENRFAAVFGWISVTKQFFRAPIAFLFAVVITLLFALPLYLLKIEFVPRDVAWLPSVAFVMFIFPARVLAGWAYARSLRRKRVRHVLLTALAGIVSFLVTIPVAAFYVLIVFLNQYTAWHGVWGMYEQHAFLLPVPFLGM
jgi:hypothetical protein